METWSYAQITDPAFLDNLAQDPESIIGKVVLELADGKIACAKRQAFLNLFWWPVLHQFNIPVCKRHFVKRVPLTRESMVDAWAPYYDEIVNQNPDNVERLKMAFWDVLQKLYLFSFTKLGSYVASVDILDVAEMMATTAMKELIDSKEKIRPSQGTRAIEKFIDAHSKDLMDMLGTKGALNNEAFYPFARLKQLNKFQIPQLLYAFGVRTDISDTVIGLPVIGSTVDGLRDIKEYAVESLSAKKSTFYSKNNVPDSQYLGRKQHLIASSIQHIYHGDCGSTQLVDFYVTANNYQNVVGKYIVENGQLVEITAANAKNYINTTIHMRSPMTCRYRHGVCEVCGGKIFTNLDKKLNLGIISAIHVIEPMTQKILSAKHMVKTTSMLYQLPPVAGEVLFCSTPTDIRWKPELYSKLNQLQLGIPITAFTGQIEDVIYLRSDKEVRETQFSSVPFFVLKNAEGITKTYPLTSKEGHNPFFSKEMLFYIRDHFNELVTDDEFRWLPLEGTSKFPIFKTVVLNNSVQVLVTNMTRFVNSTIATHTTCAGALKEFTDILYDKADLNIVHAEVLLKAYEITSPSDYSVPRVEDANNVHFQNLSKILYFRNVGVELGFEKLKGYLNNPSTYLISKGRNPFDLMIGYDTY